MNSLPKKLLILALTISSTTLFGNFDRIHLIETAKEQRVLSQKIVKSYLLLAYGADLHEIKIELNTSINKFEDNLNILRAESKNLFSSVALGVINKEAMVWYNLKVNVEKTPSDQNLNRVVELSNALLKKSHLAYTALKTEYEIRDKNYSSIDSNLKNLITISDKQQVLTERLCLYFVAQKMNVKKASPNQKIIGTLRSIVEKLDDQLITLLETSINSSETIKTIDNALFVFEDIRTNKTDFLDGKPSMNTIYVTTKKLNRLFKTLSKEYTDLATL